MGGEPARDARIVPALSQELPSIPWDERRERWLELGIVLTIAVLPPLWSAIWVRIWGSRGDPWLANESSVLVHAILVVVPILYLIRRSGDAWRCYGIVRPRWTDLLLGLVFALLFLAVATGALHAAWPFLPDAPPAMHSDARPPANVPAWTFLVVVNLANGFAEELAMRAYIMLRLRQLLGSTAGALAVSTALFASYHLYQGPVGVLNAAFFGVLHGVAFLACRRLWPIALAHGLIDVYLLAQ